MAKKLFIKTYGCQMNVYDSARMADVLAPLGYAPAEAADEADMVILNTCHIRERAAEKVYSDLGRLRAIKDARRQAGSDLILAVAGCVAQAEGAEIMRRAPFVDMVFGPQTYHRLPEMVARATRAAQARDGQAAILETDFPLEVKFDHLPDQGSQGFSAFLAIQEGCDKFCTFCVVPYTRGAEYSRPAAAVLAEARQLVAGGAREITLLGQNVNAWHGAAPDGQGIHGKEWGLGRLIRALAEIEGLARLRYTTSHPRDVDDALIAAHRDVPSLMPFLHLPVQSGADRILAAMNRQHGAEDYRRLVGRLRDACPELALSSDFIVGFPGETDAEFAETRRLIEDIGYIQAYAFKYSPRPGTPAAALDGQIPETVKEARLAEVLAVLQERQIAFNRSCVGRVLPVLFDRPGRHAGQMLGRSPYMQPVHTIHPAARMGAILKLRITEAGPNSLGGEPVSEQEHEDMACA